MVITHNQIMNFLNNDTLLQQFNISREDLERLILKAQLETTPTPPASCGCDVHLVAEYAKHYHGYFSIFVCLCGTVANMLNVAVLTRKDMASAPINRILTGLAVADILVMVEYIPFAYYYHIELPDTLNFPYAGAVFMLFHTHFCQVLHTISICLTLTLAMWRYLAIGYPEKSHTLCSDRRCAIAITLSYVIPLIICCPTFFMFKIKETFITEEGENFTLYHTALSDTANNTTFHTFSFWMYAVLIKLLPCCILTVISCWLIRTLFKAKKRKQVLKNYDICPAVVNLNDVNKKKVNKAERRADRTTRMLVAVLLLFLITEFPQGIFALRIGILGRCFFLRCYQSFGEVMDILALLNGSINFILYCCMNRMFRTTFGQLFKHKLLARWNPPPSDTHTTVTNATSAELMRLDIAA